VKERGKKNAVETMREKDVSKRKVFDIYFLKVIN